MKGDHLGRRAFGLAALAATTGLGLAGRAWAVQKKGQVGRKSAGRIAALGDDGVTLNQRVIPWPQSISAQARAALQAASRRPDISFPDPADIPAWHALVAQVDQTMTAYTRPPDPDIPVKTEQMAGVTVHRARPVSLAQDDQRLYIELHGGGLVFGAGEFCKAGAGREASLHGVETLAIDYRMPPDHPYPAALDDCIAVYAAEVKRRGADKIIVGGGSAGGYLTAALLLRAKDEGLPQPRAALLLSPKVDMTESGDSFETLMGLDPVLKRRLTECVELYANGHDLRHPYLSPLFGDLKGLPPIFLQSGTRDLYLSNTVRMHRALRAAGVAADLHVFEAMPHGRFFAGPEDAELDSELKSFVASHWQQSAIKS